jgi:hypothetical protein
LFSKFFKDKNERVVIWQWPNIYLWLWLGLYAASKVINDSETKQGFQLVGNAVLLTWAIKEIWQGESYFRRLLGVLVGVSTIAWFINAPRN